MQRIVRVSFQFDVQLFSLLFALFSLMLALSSSFSFQFPVSNSVRVSNHLPPAAAGIKNDTIERISITTVVEQLFTFFQAFDYESFITCRTLVLVWFDVWVVLASYTSTTMTGWGYASSIDCHSSNGIPLCHCFSFCLLLLSSTTKSFCLPF